MARDDLEDQDDHNERPRATRVQDRACTLAPHVLAGVLER
jgi:hypothetical protein